MKKLWLLGLSFLAANAYASGIYNPGSAGGGGGGSSLQITRSGVEITSPTASINLNGQGFITSAVGSTTTISLNPATTDFIHNQSSPQTASLSVDNGSFNTQLTMPYLGSGQIPFNSGSGVMSGDAGLAWDTSAGALTLGSGSGDGSSWLTINNGSAVYGLIVKTGSSNENVTKGLLTGTGSISNTLANDNATLVTQVNGSDGVVSAGGVSGTKAAERLYLRSVGNLITPTDPSYSEMYVGHGGVAVMAIPPTSSGVSISTPVAPFQVGYGTASPAINGIVSSSHSAVIDYPGNAFWIATDSATKVSTLIGVKNGLSVIGTSTTTWNLPTADGSAGQSLKTDGSGTFSFVSNALASDLFATSSATGTLATSLFATSTTTGTLATSLFATSSATGTLATSLFATSTATGTIVPALLISTNEWSGGNTYSGPVSVRASSVTINNTTTTNALRVNQTGNVGASSSVGGAINVTNTSNTGAALVAYTNQAAPNDNLVNLRVDNNSFTQSAVFIDFRGGHNATPTPAVSIVSSGTASGYALNVVGKSTGTSSFQLSGNEATVATFKITHTSPTITAGQSDVNASAISVALAGAGTNAQGIFVDATATGGTTGKLMNIRNGGEEFFTLDGLKDATIKYGLTVGTLTVVSSSTVNSTETVNTLKINLANQTNISTGTPLSISANGVLITTTGVNEAVITANQNITLPTWARLLRVRICGGGGGGGGGSGAATTVLRGGASGGGGAACVERTIDLTRTSSNFGVTVGTAGTGGGGGTGVVGSSGSQGTDSYFYAIAGSTFVFAGGGGGGAASISSGTAGGGGGGSCGRGPSGTNATTILGGCPNISAAVGLGAGGAGAQLASVGLPSEYGGSGGGGGTASLVNGSAAGSTFFGGGGGGGSGGCNASNVCGTPGAGGGPNPNSSSGGGGAAGTSGTSCTAGTSGAAGNDNVGGQGGGGGGSDQDSSAASCTGGTGGLCGGGGGAGGAGTNVGAAGGNGGSGCAYLWWW